MNITLTIFPSPPPTSPPPQLTPLPPLPPPHIATLMTISSQSSPLPPPQLPPPQLTPPPPSFSHSSRYLLIVERHGRIVGLIGLVVLAELSRLVFQCCIWRSARFCYRTDHSSSGRIIMGGMSAAVFGAICMLVGNKIYPLAWNCGR